MGVIAIYGLCLEGARCEVATISGVTVHNLELLLHMNTLNIINLL